MRSTLQAKQLGGDFGFDAQGLGIDGVRGRNSDSRTVASSQIRADDGKAFGRGQFKELRQGENGQTRIVVCLGSRQSAVGQCGLLL